MDAKTPESGVVSGAMRILLADDHPLYLSGVKSLIHGETGHRVVAEAADGNECIELARLHRPDLCLMDIGMPVIGGLEACRQIRVFMPEIRVLLLSMYREAEFVRQALAMGASGYLLKDNPPAEILEALARVSAGKRFLSPGLSDMLPGLLRESRPVKTSGGLEAFTPRERQILGLVAGGSARGDLAKRLHVSPETLKTHLGHMMRKARTHDFPSLQRFARRHCFGSETGRVTRGDEPSPTGG